MAEDQGRSLEMAGLLRRAMRRVLRARKTLLMLFVLLIPLLLVTAYAVAVHITQRMVDREIASLRASGEPIALSELAPAVPPFHENAADVYQRAFDSFISPTEAETQALYGPGPWSADDLATARRFVEVNATYFRLLDHAARLPDCAFPVDWAAGAAITCPHYAKMREAARALIARTRLLSVEGKHDEAVDSIITMVNIAEHAKAEPTLIGQLVGYAIQNIAADAARTALSGAAPTREACRRAFDRIGAIDQVGPFVTAMKGERLLGIDVYDGLRTGRYAVQDWIGWLRDGLRDGLGERVIGWYATFGRPLLNLDEVSYLRAMAQQIDAVSVPSAQAEDHLKRAAEAWEQIPAYRAVVSSMITPGFNRAVRSRDEKTALLGALQIALSLKGYRAAHGAYPETLAKLEADGWDLPVDVFTGEPYLYRRDGAGFVVWSVGLDKDDDGGRALDYRALQALSPSQREKAKEDYDVSFACSE